MVDSWVDDGTVGSVAAAVVGRDGDVLERRYAGADERSLFALASVTKPIVALASLVAVEEGALELDARSATTFPSTAMGRGPRSRSATCCRTPPACRRRRKTRPRSGAARLSAGDAPLLFERGLPHRRPAAGGGHRHALPALHRRGGAGSAGAWTPGCRCPRTRRGERSMSRPRPVGARRALLQRPRVAAPGDGGGRRVRQPGRRGRHCRGAAAAGRPAAPPGVVRRAGVGAVPRHPRRPGIVSQAALPGLGAGPEHSRRGRPALGRRRRVALDAVALRGLRHPGCGSIRRPGWRWSA